MAEKKSNAPVFKLAALEGSKKYQAKIDLLRVLLNPDKEYTEAEIEDILAKELARPVVKEVN